jgi:hypothetical protein
MQRNGSDVNIRNIYVSKMLKGSKQGAAIEMAASGAHLNPCS